MCNAPILMTWKRVTLRSYVGAGLYHRSESSYLLMLRIARMPFIDSMLCSPDIRTHPKSLSYEERDFVCARGASAFGGESAHKPPLLPAEGGRVGG